LRSQFDGWRLRTSTTATDSTNSLSFAWFGSDANNTGTWDYAPLDEFAESEPERFNQWRDRIETDRNYFNQQLNMNRVHDTWHTQWTDTCTNAGNTVDFTFNFNGTTMTNDWAYHPRINLNESRLTKVKNWLNKYLKLNRTAEEIQEERAEKKSWKLVKEWLTKEEFAELTNKGQMEIQSKEDSETIYIVKKDYLATVQEVKKGKHIKSMCVIPKEIGLASGDALLSKIMLLKTDEKQFKKIAVIQNRV